ncbi:MAG TPA: type III polyketide synthase [Mycobacteriales bacterium]|jgi:predicted naringenin-chalcone synthase|nr:type III polyketide synthase [Mycobacteriales bacterium]
MVTARVASIATTVPAPMDQQALWDGYFSRHYAGSPLAEKVWRSSGVVTRHGAVHPLHEDVSGWDTGDRMRRYLAEAMPLGKDAVTRALDTAGVTPEDVGLFAVVSCTGYATPGLDILLARDLGMRPDVQRLFVGHMGCYAAIPGLSAVADSVAARGLTAVLLCAELPSVHVQPATDEAQQMVAHALFSDAVTAAVLTPDATGLEVVDVTARTDVAHHEDMTWDVTGRGFRMGLSPRVPDVLARHVKDVVDELLARHGLTVPDVRGWAIHPGGPRIVDVCGEQLGLDEAALAPARETLRDYGNCSSPTVLMVLDAVRRATPPAPGDHVVALAFGPGLTLYGALLRQSR